jgi:hypothetical protein
MFITGIETQAGREMRAIDAPMDKPTYWQLIFLQSKVNGASYNGDALARHNWDWPKGTYLQRRLHRIKFLNAVDHSNPH